MNDQLVAMGHHKDCIAKILNNCWQCKGRFGMGICDRGENCDRKIRYPGCSPECKVKKGKYERGSDALDEIT